MQLYIDIFAQSSINQAFGLWSLSLSLDLYFCFGGGDYGDRKGNYLWRCRTPHGLFRRLLLPVDSSRVAKSQPKFQVNSAKRPINDIDVHLISSRQTRRYLARHYYIAGPTRTQNTKPNTTNLYWHLARKWQRSLLTSLPPAAPCPETSAPPRPGRVCITETGVAPPGHCARSF